MLTCDASAEVTIKGDGSCKRILFLLGDCRADTSESDGGKVKNDLLLSCVTVGSGGELELGFSPAELFTTRGNSGGVLKQLTSVISELYIWLVTNPGSGKGW